MSYYFSKKFEDFNLGNVNYYICNNCGFTSSKDHYDLSQGEWEKLNFEYHSKNNERDDNPYNRNQRYFNQALMISLMKSFHFFEEGEFLDWGSGTGSVSILSEKLFNIKINNYDQYIKPKINSIIEKKLNKRSFELVINCAVFEHVRSVETLNEIEQYVSKTGSFAIHTLIPDKVPKDPNWMYLLPVHCSFHTNSSMNILMEKWGYQCSVYNEHAKLWVLFKRNSEIIFPLVNELNKFLGWEYLKYKNGFMDFWK